jgi:hypothetical protein
MPAERSPFLLKLLPSFSDFAFVMPMAFLFGRMNGTQTLLGDCDTGWHIRTGEWIAANHAVPRSDIFSYSRAGNPWFAWEWLSDLLFGWLNGHGGLRAVVLFSVLLLSVTFLLLFRLVRVRSNTLVAILITILAAAASGIHWLARPHLFTLLFLVLFYAALERVKRGHTRLGRIPYLAILPFATVLWTNLHGGFFVGVLMIAAYGAGEALALILSQKTSAGRSIPAGTMVAGGWGKAGRYFLSAIGCLAASLINPYTYRLHVYLTAYLHTSWQHVMEYLSPDFHHPLAIYFESLLILAAAAAYWNLSKGRFTEPLLIAMWGHAALLAQRNIPIFAIVAAVPVAASVQEWLDVLPGLNVAGWLRSAARNFNDFVARTGETEQVGRFHLFSLAACLLLAAVLWAPNPPKKFRAEFDPNRYPAGALATLRRDPSARIFTDDEWGDYLIWSLYPAHRVFADGRADFYGEQFMGEMLDVLNVKYNWENTLARFGVDTVLLPVKAPLAGALKESGRWRVVFDDGVALVFRSAGKAA